MKFVSFDLALGNRSSITGRSLARYDSLLGARERKWRPRADPAGFVQLAVWNTWPESSPALVIKKVLTLGADRSCDDGGFHVLLLFVDGGGKDEAESLEGHHSPALSRALSLNGGLSTTLQSTIDCYFILCDHSRLHFCVTTPFPCPIRSIFVSYGETQPLSLPTDSAGGDNTLGEKDTVPAPTDHCSFHRQSSRDEMKTLYVIGQSNPESESERMMKSVGKQRRSWVQVLILRTKRGAQTTLQRYIRKCT